MGGTNEFSEVWGYPRGTPKLFGREGLKIGAHFYLSCSAWLLRTPKCSKLPDCPQESSVRSPQFQNGVFFLNRSSISRFMADIQGPEIKDFLAARGWKSGLICTYLALLGFYGLKSAQNSLIALWRTQKGPLGAKQNLAVTFSPIYWCLKKPWFSVSVYRP